jgi:hypothetical protein
MAYTANALWSRQWTLHSQAKGRLAIKRMLDLWYSRTAARRSGSHSPRANRPGHTADP